MFSRPMLRRLPWLTASAVTAGVAIVLLCCARAQEAPAPPATPQGQAEAQARGAADDEYADARERMVAGLIRQRYLRTEPVIKAMRETKRHLFTPRSLWPRAYVDRPLPIGHDQTISAPSIVALMTELIEPGPETVMLEIGTGSGYQAAVLAPLVKHVYTIEIVEPLANRAAETLKDLGYENVTVKYGDGYKGWPEHAPFDGIMVTCAPEKVPQPLVDQLKEGGRMVIPVGKQWEQELYLLRKVDGELERTAIIPVLFVPMTGEAQEKE